jgi:hypothetical protein
VRKGVRNMDKYGMRRRKGNRKIETKNRKRSNKKSGNG